MYYDGNAADAAKAYENWNKLIEGAKEDTPKIEEAVLREQEDEKFYTQQQKEADEE